MATRIDQLVNNSAGAIALLDNSVGFIGGSFCVTSGNVATALWFIKTTPYAQAIVGPGATGIGPGTYDWIWDDEYYHIMIQRAGQTEPRIWITLPRDNPRLYTIQVSYGPNGMVSATLTN